MKMLNINASFVNGEHINIMSELSINYVDSIIRYVDDYAKSHDTKVYDCIVKDTKNGFIYEM